MNVLVVEDNQANQLVAKAVLAQLGISVTIAEDGQQALQWLSQDSPDLILMDCLMPVLDGFQTTREIRRQQANKALPYFPIIALTASNGSREKQQCLAAGMDDLLAKPFDFEQLKHVINKWYHNKEAVMPESEFILDSAQVDTMRTLLGDGFSQLVEAATGVAEEAYAALANGSVSDAGNHAHRLKSTAANMGGTQLAELLREVEDQAQAERLTPELRQQACHHIEGFIRQITGL